jgi:signal transduction histidine kinase
VIRRKLLAILFICILLPVVITLVESTRTIISQKNAMTNISSTYVKNLSAYAADRWNEGNAERITAFLSLVADHGYDRLISIKDMGRLHAPVSLNVRGMREKFIPGLVAYVSDSGRLVSCSQNAAILVNIFANAPMMNTRDGSSREGSIISKFRVGRDDITYVAYVTPTKDPRVYAVAAVTMLSWMGMNDFNLIKLATAGSLSMFMCLLGLLLLRSSVILPLQALSSQVETLEWGREAPQDADSGNHATMQVEEISSLKKAIVDLARRMIDKEELEKRYMGDIMKAQEDERGRIAQDIHDGPIQVASALIQRIQIANITSGDIGEETMRHLMTAESVAQDLVKDLRDICDSLVPPWVSLGIVSCMEESASRFERQHSIRINMNIDQALEIPLEQTLALFRIFQEAVSNSVRHGRATEVDVEVVSREGGQGVSFSVRDNGAGFVPRAGMIESLRMEGKRGLNGMRQRAELLGGEFSLLSSPEEGTTITITL